MSNKKVVVVGGVAGGASTAARVRRLDEFAEIMMFEQGPYVSFSNCCIPFHIGGLIESADNLLLMSVEEFDKQYNIQAKVKHRVVAINRDRKTVTVHNLVDDVTFEETYDKLVLAPGASEIMPKAIKGIDSPNVFPMKTVPHLRAFMDYVQTNNVENVAVVGAGFIGLEVAENLKHSGYNVSIIEAQNQILTPLDYDMVQTVNRELMEQGVDLYLEEAVTEIRDTELVLDSGKTVKAEAVVMAVGIKPNSGLALDAGLEVNDRGFIKVNHHYQTTDSDIYAVGDAIEVYDFFTGKRRVLSLAGPAQRQARAAADHMYGRTYRHTGVIGSSSIKLFNLNIANTGLNEKQCQEAGIEYDFAYVIPKDSVGIMPSSKNFFFKLLFATPSGQILGAQAVSQGDAAKRIDVIATAIMNRANLEDLKELELSYSPHFSTAKDVVNHAALVGLNILNGDVKKVPVTKVRELVETGAFIIDAREENEYALSHINGARNIPLSQFRERLDEIPQDQPVYIHCRSSQRSYNMIRALMQRGYENVYNIDGSFLGISEYEYFNDKVLGREPIVTDYNFK